MSKIKVTILGSGSMGTALAHLIGTNGYHVVMWGIDNEIIDSINNLRENKKSLSGIKLPHLVKGTLDITEALQNANVVIVAVPTQAIASVLIKASACFNSQMIFLSVSKGIENKTGKLVSQIIKDHSPKSLHSHIGVLMGPLFASEISSKIPSVGVVALPQFKDFQIVREVLTSDYFYVRHTNDVTGAELGGALKNIYAILLGVCDGLDYGWNTKSAIMSAAIKELAVVGYYLGGKKETLYGLSGLGDLLTTGFGEKSRNRRFGEKLCSGETVSQVLKDIGQVVEGVETLKIATKLLAKFKKQTPLLHAVDEMVHAHKNPCLIFKKLLKDII